MRLQLVNEPEATLTKFVNNATKRYRHLHSSLSRSDFSRKPWHLGAQRFFVVSNNLDCNLEALSRTIGDNMLAFWNPPDEMVEDESTRAEEGECPVKQYDLFYCCYVHPYRH